MNESKTTNKGSKRVLLVLSILTMIICVVLLGICVLQQRWIQNEKAVEV